MRTEVGYAIVDKKRNIPVTLDERLPVYWSKSVAKKAAKDAHLNTLDFIITRVEVIAQR